MRLLLDTSAFLWFVEGSGRLSEAAKNHIEDTGNELFLSVASVWEMAIKISLGKLEIARPLAEFVPALTTMSSIGYLPIYEQHAIGVAILPFHHRDPFDRLLISQCLVDQLVIITPDPSFDCYGVERIW